jgi:hypothetical protein
MQYNNSHHNLEDYQKIQSKVRAYRDQGKTNIRLNSEKADLESELNELEQKECCNWFIVGVIIITLLPVFLVFVVIQLVMPENTGDAQNDN